jgi:quinoprotein glucose dehydrogenase
MVSVVRTNSLRAAAAVVILAGLAFAPRQAGEARQVRKPESRRTWMDYGGAPDNARYVTLDQITKSNVARLEIAWTYPTRDELPYVFSPVIVDNVMYVLARNNSLVALDAATGREIWVHENLQGIAPRGINYWESKDRKDRRLLYQRNHHLEAIDAVTGKPILTFGTQGAVNMREGYLGRDAATIGRVQSSTPGKIFENLILLGSATGENYMATPGDLRAYDVVTGKEVWRFRTIPHPGEFGYDTWPKDAYKYVGGTNTWGEISVDAARGIAYFPTGSPTYDYYGADRAGANLFGTALLALDARTGKRLWHFQMVHHDLWDYDNCAAPQLTTIRRNGRNVDVVAQAGKTGFLYVFDRVTGEPIWPIEERPVPKSDMPGEQAWPTQPFPTAPPPFASQTLSVDDLNPHVLTPAEREQWRTRLSNARNNGLFTPPALIDTVSIPGANGGANWGNTAAHPTNGFVYVQSINVPSIYRLSLDEPGRGGGPGRGANAPPAAIAQGQAIYTQRCQSCHAPDLRGTANLPSLVGVTVRLSPEMLRDVISGGRQAMPPFRDLSPAEMDALVAYLGSAAAASGRGARGTPPPSLGGPVVASGGAPGARGVGGRGGGMIGPAYPPGLDVPTVRYYTGYGLSNTIVKPPYSTLTAYDLNSGTIKWQIPTGDEPRAAGVTGTGVISQRSGIIVTSTGLLFHAGEDGKVRAHDAANGKVLWTGTLPAGSRGGPAMYEVGGRQYLVVNASQVPTGGRVPIGTGERAYVAFALKK